MADTSDAVGEGKQLQLLKVILRKAYEDIVSGISEDEFLESFSALGIPRKSLRMLLEAFKSTVVKDCLKKIYDSIESDNVDEYLRMREELLQEQKEFVGTVAWRPSGSVSNDIRAHDIAVYKAKSEQLSVMQDQEERKANELLSKLTKARYHIQHCQMQLTEEWETVNKLVENVQHQEEVHEKLMKMLAGPSMM